jgi:hypothetical protein
LPRRVRIVAIMRWAASATSSPSIRLNLALVRGEDTPDLRPEFLPELRQIQVRIPHLNTKYKSAYEAHKVDTRYQYNTATYNTATPIQYCNIQDRPIQYCNIQDRPIQYCNIPKEYCGDMTPSMCIFDIPEPREPAERAEVERGDFMSGLARATGRPSASRSLSIPRLKPGTPPGGPGAFGGRVAVPDVAGPDSFFPPVSHSQKSKSVPSCLSYSLSCAKAP